MRERNIVNERKKNEEINCDGSFKEETLKKNRKRWLVQSQRPHAFCLATLVKARKHFTAISFYVAMKPKDARRADNSEEGVE